MSYSKISWLPTVNLLDFKAIKLTIQGKVSFCRMLWLLANLMEMLLLMITMMNQEVWLYLEQMDFWQRISNSTISERTKLSLNHVLFVGIWNFGFKVARILTLKTFRPLIQAQLERYSGRNIEERYSGILMDHFRAQEPLHTSFLSNSILQELQVVPIIQMLFGIIQLFVIWAKLKLEMF